VSGWESVVAVKGRRCGRVDQGDLKAPQRDLFVEIGTPDVDQGRRRSAK
jgi:hypothetical protein